MGILKEAKVKVRSINITGKDECNVSFGNFGRSPTYLHLSMTQEDALKYKIDDEYIIQLRDVEGQLEPHVIDHQPIKE